MTGTTPTRVTLYTKEGCTLCKKVREMIVRVGRDYPLTLEEFDITTDPEIFERYGQSIPVVHIDGRETFISKVSELWLRRALSRKQRTGLPDR